MKKQSPKVIFFGSGPVAAQSLELLLEHIDVEAVVTKPNPAHHRGIAPVIELAEQKKLTYYTPASKSELTDLIENRPFESAVGIVIDYGIIIDQAVIDAFPFGIVNSHFSLLPQWRGADPITFSLLSGQEKTGVSLMVINAAMDEGPLIAREEIIVQPQDTSLDLTKKLIRLSDNMLRTHFVDYLNGSISPGPQQGEASYSRKLTKADGLVDWTKPAEVIEREIRAFYEWPKSTAKVGNHQLIIRNADVVKTSGIPGEYTFTKKELIVFCGQDALSLNVVQPVNKKEMPVQAFLAGYSL